eukprot:4633375-Amphidinium_carterae.1
MACVRLHGLLPAPPPGAVPTHEPAWLCGVGVKTLQAIHSGQRQPKGSLINLKVRAPNEPIRLGKRSTMGESPSRTATVNRKLTWWLALALLSMMLMSLRRNTSAGKLWPC